jgi:uncharacterized protein YjiS (DUF1127 family)
MIDLENGASARLPAAHVWLERGESLARTAAGVVGGMLRWLERARARRAALRELYRLDDRLLQDIGLRRDQVGELVDGMFRRSEPRAAARPVDNVVVAGGEDVDGVRAGNDGEYRAAA